MSTEPLHYRLFPLGFSARYLRVPPEWLRGECESGKLPHLKAGNKILLDLHIVERLLWERAQSSIASENAGRAP